ncbi:hypothetical protein VNI00_000778 [Paramarasmius palmivorus]|uniref:Uncharacterized protein n=1 Tax=Paramarasmius palmivorus TaxID=297713 RepID=A0AAW0E8J8_9AGAR
MRTFLLSLLASAACVVAAPAHPLPTAALAAPAGKIFDPRCDCTYTPLPDIINDTKDKVTPLVDQLKSLGASDCTPDKIQPIVTEIKGVIHAGIDELNILVDADLDLNAILTTGTSTISVDVVAKVLADLSVLIFASLSVVLKLVVSAQLSAVVAIFADLCVSISAFLKISLNLLAVANVDLIAVVVPIIKASLAVVIQLGVTSSFDFLSIDFGKLAAELNVSALIGVGVGVGVGVAAGVSAGATVSLVAILNDFTAKCQPLIDQLQGLSGSDVTAAQVGPIVAQIKALIVAATVQVQLLVGLSLDVVLASGSGAVISIDACAQLIAKITVSLLAAISVVLKVVVAAELKAVVSIFADLTVTLAAFLKVIVSIGAFNGGLVAILTPLIRVSLGVAISLGCTDAFAFLGLDFKKLGAELGIAVAVGAVVSLPAIIADISVKIDPLVVQLKALAAADVNGDKVGAITAQIKAIIVAATAQVKLLAGVDVKVALASADGVVLSVSACASLIAKLCASIFAAIDVVIGLVATVDAKVVFGLCADLAVAIGAFIQVCCSVIVGLQVSLVALLSTSLAVCIKLAVTDVFAFLGVDFKGLAVKLGISISGALSAKLA